MIYGLTVGRNEMDRYLGAMLLNMSSVVDAHFFYDDLSTDGTLDLAEVHGCVVDRRQQHDVSFLQHEGLFRQNAWRRFERIMKPEEGDWVLAIDCDEILVSDAQTPLRLEMAVDAANRRGQIAVMLPIPEVFGLEENGRPLVRIDGLWGRIAGTRLFAYRRGGVYKDARMGSGAEPTYVVETGAWSHETQGLYLMHYGYADPADVSAKYQRYSSLAHGHADAHIESIPAQPVLRPWDGPWVRMPKGIKFELAEAA